MDANVKEKTRVRCNICGLFNITKEACANHVAILHGIHDVNKIDCGLCDATTRATLKFGNTGARTAHYKHHHPGTSAYICAVCGHGVMTVGEVYTHLSTCARVSKKRLREADLDVVGGACGTSSAISITDEANTAYNKVARSTESPRQTIERLQSEEMALRMHITTVLIAHRQIMEQIWRAQMIAGDPVDGDVFGWGSVINGTVGGASPRDNTSNSCQSSVNNAGPVAADLM
jgi:hypothetical protein